MKKILFTGVGRRIELLQAYKQASLKLGIDIKIFGADMAGNAPALCYCDETRHICAMKDPDYIRQLAAICAEDNIDIVIPTIDTDLQVLADNRSVFENSGTRVLISDPDMIRICRDKNLTTGFFEKCGLKAPRTCNDYAGYEEDFPCFIKPKDGSSSINAFKVENEEELAFYAGLIGDYVIQQFIDGIEFTVDAFCDFDGDPVYITPRIREAVRAGEVLKTRIVNDEKIISEMKALIGEFKPCGPITVQLIRDRKTGDDYYIEINPRYGGGAPLSMKAGARSAEILLGLLDEESPGYIPGAARDNAVYSRFDHSVCIASSDRREYKGVIFDLDDTIYPETGYIKSGYRKIALYLGDETYAAKLWEYYKNGKQAINELLKETGREEELDRCIEIYREQDPDIKLYSGVTELIAGLNSNGIKTGIITDGRVSGQYKKIKALGLDKLFAPEDIIVTDELGGVQFRKPDDIAFRIMQKRWRISFDDLVYVGDNISKDHLAPLQLGMDFIYYDNPDGIYPGSGSVLEIKTVRNISELGDMLLK